MLAGSVTLGSFLDAGERNGRNALGGSLLGGSLETPYREVKPNRVQG